MILAPAINIQTYLLTYFDQVQRALNQQPTRKATLPKGVKYDASRLYQASKSIYGRVYT